MVEQNQESNTGNIKQYIVTDPCYIMDDKEYDTFGDSVGWEMDFDTEKVFTRRYHAEEKITIFKNKHTHYGDGSSLYHGQEIGVDSGQLCIAFNKEGWTDELCGATFNSLSEARKAFSQIIRRF